MKHSTKLFMTTLISALIVACGGGGGGGGSTTPPAPTPSVQVLDNTADIVAERDFSFDIGEKITLSVNYTGSTEGALHLYSKAAYTTANGDVIADPTSRITTLYPNMAGDVELEVNGNWTHLYAQWVPMSAQESEQNWSIALNNSNNNYHIDF
ncbi:TPA: hypothetical protein KDY52_002230 [Vibrio parahaemolyticus]|uniref:hypothetical protein n=1 Tax=Vibrio parahaemolyticus TaxID=670 RepID=UPI00186A718F|nr:hypothetical protein [Vibrio parahaemolyticus]MBE3865188.1 hypothetical protein [Vibrio parahaemolyticus]MCZ5879020.1 hypothetical protein [Vibrio parahaemolyticus]MCZ6370151.1 hypothetical protein [Vibrio parahaemolyticus]MDG3045721.1 hypothetical protein [Vibrio parahaemolyticus]HBC3458048.1 hypothetical protein [Vibrio parahaemolyticus]